MPVRKRNVIYLGAEVEMEEKRAQRLVERGEAVYAETVKKSAPPKAAKKGAPETATTGPDETREKPAAKKTAKKKPAAKK